MKIYAISDLHIDRCDRPHTPPSHGDADVVVVAGDVCDGVDSIEFLRRFEVPVVMVLGNHDYFIKEGRGSMDMEDVVNQMRERLADTNVRLLERDGVNIGGTTFLGGTMWTNAANLTSMALSSSSAMTDHRYIVAKKAWARLQRSSFLDSLMASRGGLELELIRSLLREGQESGRMNGLLHAFLHEEWMSWFSKRISQSTDGPQVVVTHHAPSRRSLMGAGLQDEVFERLDTQHGLASASERMSAAWATYYACSDDKPLQAATGAVSCWIHGHVHTACDYAQGGVRVVCNPMSLSYALAEPAVDRRYVIDPADGIAQNVSECVQRNLVEVRAAVDDFEVFAERFTEVTHEVDITAISESLAVRCEMASASYKRWISEMCSFIYPEREMLNFARLGHIYCGHPDIVEPSFLWDRNCERRIYLDGVRRYLRSMLFFMESSVSLTEGRNKYLAKAVEVVTQSFSRDGLNFEVASSLHTSVWSPMFLLVNVRGAAVNHETVLEAQSHANQQLANLYLDLGCDGFLTAVVHPGVRSPVVPALLVLINGQEFWYGAHS